MLEHEDAGMMGQFVVIGRARTLPERVVEPYARNHARQHQSPWVGAETRRREPSWTGDAQTPGAGSDGAIVAVAREARLPSIPSRPRVQAMTTIPTRSSAPMWINPSW